MYLKLNHSVYIVDHTRRLSVDCTKLQKALSVQYILSIYCFVQNSKALLYLDYKALFRVIGKSGVAAASSSRGEGWKSGS